MSGCDDERESCKKKSLQISSTQKFPLSSYFRRLWLKKYTRKIPEKMYPISFFIVVCCLKEIYINFHYSICIFPKVKRKHVWSCEFSSTLLSMSSEKSFSEIPLYSETNTSVQFCRNIF